MSGLESLRKGERFNVPVPIGSCLFRNDDSRVGINLINLHRTEHNVVNIVTSQTYIKGIAGNLMMLTLNGENETVRYSQWVLYTGLTVLWPTTLVCIHFCQTQLTELPIILNPSLPLSRISNNSKFCNGSVNFEITRYMYIYIHVCIYIYLSLKQVYRT